MIIARTGIIKDAKLFYFQRAAHAKKGAGLWEWAGGQLEAKDFSDTSDQRLIVAIGRAAARETYEETGLAVRFRSLPKEIGRRIMSGGIHEGRQQILYGSLAVHEDGTPTVDPDEHQDFKLLSYSEAIALTEAGLVTPQTAVAHEKLLPSIIVSSIDSEKSYKNTIYSGA